MLLSRIISLTFGSSDCLQAATNHDHRTTIWEIGTEKRKREEILQVNHREKSRERQRERREGEREKERERERDRQTDS